jgi:hypothetical protein
MAHTFDTNSLPATGAQCIHKLLTALLAQLWTKPKDSDGTTYSASGVQITGFNSGTNGLANTSAWFVVRDPNSARSFCFQRGTTNLLWRTKYSAGAGFTGGSPSATQVPSATDEQVLQGAGTDASPTFHTFFGADGTLRFNCMAGDSTVGYSFFWDAFTAGNAGSPHFGMALDVMAAGSFPAADTDPAIIYLVNKGNGGTAAAWGTDLTVVITTCFAFFSNTHTSTNWKGCLAVSYYDPLTGIKVAPAQAVGQGVGTNAFTSKDDGFPLMFARPVSETGGPFGYKGFGSIHRASGVFRANYDAISNTGVASRDKIWLNGILLPWDGSIPSI